MKRAKKEYPDDDGRTIVNMNVDGFSWYRGETEREKPAAKKSRKEKKALARAAYLSTAVPLICLAVGVTVAFAVLYFIWL